MSKKNKHKKNKKSFVNQNNQNKPPANVVESTPEDLKLITESENLAKLENHPVDLLSEGTTSTSEIKTEVIKATEASALKAKVDEGKNTVSEQELKLKQDLERDAHITLESEAEHASHANKTPNNFVPFWTGILVGALVMYFLL